MRKKGHYNLKTRLLAVISFLIFSSVFLVSTISTMRYSDALIEQTTDQVQQLLDQVAINTGNYIDELSRLCMAPYYSSHVMKLLETSPENNADILEKQRTIENYLREVMTIPRKDILRVNILSDRAYSSSRTGHVPSYLNNYREQDWFQNSISEEHAIFIPAYEESFGAYKVTVFSMVLRLQSLSDSRNTLGVIRVDANYSGIKDVLDDVELPDQSALYIFDTNGTLIYERNALHNPIEVETVFLESHQDGAPHSFVIGRERYYLNTAQIKGTDWTVAEVNARSVIMRNVFSVRRFAVISAVLCGMLGMITAVFFSRAFVRPINNTVEVMRAAQLGDFNVRASESRANEINYLNQAFNEMLQKISDTMNRNSQLTREMYEAKYLQKKAQYNALYHQIRPHFLFNTLSTVSILIKSGRDAEAVQSIEELSVLLRGMVNTDKDITLASEIKIAECYLSLQERRHDSLAFSISMDERVSDKLIPALTIQPIVENALIHGCEPRQGDMMISITASLAGNDVLIRVSDNGVGISKQDLILLQNEVDQPDPETLGSENRGVGLQNISQRLRLRFGKQYGLTIESSPDKGTEVIIKIPFSETEGAKLS